MRVTQQNPSLIPALVFNSFEAFLSYISLSFLRHQETQRSVNRRQLFQVLRWCCDTSHTDRVRRDALGEHLDKQPPKHSEVEPTPFAFFRWQCLPTRLYFKNPIGICCNNFFTKISANCIIRFLCLLLLTQSRIHFLTRIVMFF